MTCAFCYLLNIALFVLPLCVLQDDIQDQQYIASIRVSVCQSFYLSIYLFIYLSTNLFIYISICLHM